MPTAAPADVRTVIDTNLTDDDLSDVLSGAERDIDREYDDTDAEFDDDQHRADFEAVLTALRVVTGREREIMVERRGQVRVDYGPSQINRLQSRLARLDPGEEFSRAGGVKRNSDRYVNATDGGD